MDFKMQKNMNCEWLSYQAQQASRGLLGVKQLPMFQRVASTLLYYFYSSGFRILGSCFQVKSSKFPGRGKEIVPTNAASEAMFLEEQSLITL